MGKLILLLCFCLLSSISKTQIKEEYLKNTTDKQSQIKLGIPIASGIILTGVFMEYSRLFDKEHFQNKVLNRFPNTKTHIDDYFQFTPIAMTLVLNALGKKGEHKFSSQIKRLLVAEALCNLSVYILKTQTKHLRPDNSGTNSFPSGHTAQAFTAAVFLDKEYGKQYPWLRWAGYSMAITTGICRVLKNRHWTSDVMLGAGIGILSTNLSYYIFHKWENKKKIKINPIIGEKTYGLSLKYNF